MESYMIAALQFEARNNPAMFHNAMEWPLPEAGDNLSSPVSEVFSDDSFKIESSIKSGFETCVVVRGSTDADKDKRLDKEFAGFTRSIAALGENEDSPPPPAIVACDPIGAISAFGQAAVSVMAQSVSMACASLAAFFGPDANQVSRMVFSGFVLASATVRAVLPIVKDALMNVPDPAVQFAVTVVSFSLAALHLLLSTVATVIATNNLPALFSRNNLDPDGKSNVENFGEALNSLFRKVEDKLAELSQKGLVGWLGLVREWLLTSAAVVGFLSVLPLLVKTVGTIISAPIAAIVGGSITLAASIFEFVQGFKERDLLREELQMLTKKAGDNPTAVEKAAIQEKTRALLASNIRIGKSIIGILTSVASIVLGALTLAASIALPYLPAVLTTISLLGLVVYLSVTTALREMRKQEEAALKSLQESVPDAIDPTR
jgi:hypothetical protein